MTASEGRAHQASRLQSNQEKDKRKQLEDAEKTNMVEKERRMKRFILDLENKRVNLTNTVGTAEKNRSGQSSS